MKLTVDSDCPSTSGSGSMIVTKQRLKQSKLRIRKTRRLLNAEYIKFVAVSEDPRSLEKVLNASSSVLEPVQDHFDQRTPGNKPQDIEPSASGNIIPIENSARESFPMEVKKSRESKRCAQGMLEGVASFTRKVQCKERTMESLGLKGNEEERETVREPTMTTTLPKTSLNLSSVYLCKKCGVDFSRRILYVNTFESHQYQCTGTGGQGSKPSKSKIHHPFYSLCDTCGMTISRKHLHLTKCRGPPRPGYFWERRKKYATSKSRKARYRVEILLRRLPSSDLTVTSDHCQGVPPSPISSKLSSIVKKHFKSQDRVCTEKKEESAGTGTGSQSSTSRTMKPCSSSGSKVAIQLIELSSDDEIESIEGNKSKLTCPKQQLQTGPSKSHELDILGKSRENDFCLGDDQSNDVKILEGASTTRKSVSDENQTYAFHQSSISTDLPSFIEKTFSINHENFLLELILNAADALERRRYTVNSNSSQRNNEHGLLNYIKIIPNQVEKTLTVLDTGIGMTKLDLVEYLSTIYKSGTKSFLENMDTKCDLNLFGKDGIGFLSSFYVATKVTVTTKNEQDKQYIWEGTPQGDVIIKEKASRRPSYYFCPSGTEVKLHLKPEYLQYCQETKIKELLENCKESLKGVNFPIELVVRMLINPADH